MKRILLFGVGSPLVVDVEENLLRPRVILAAGIRNTLGDSHLLDSSKVIEMSDVPPELKTLPYLVPLLTPVNRWTAVQEAERHGFSNQGSLIDASVPCPRNIHYRPGLYGTSHLG